MGKNSKKAKKNEKPVVVEEEVVDTEGQEILDEQEAAAEYPVNTIEDFYGKADENGEAVLRSWKQSDFGYTREKKILFCDYMVLRWDARRRKLKTVPTKEEKEKAKLQKKVDKMKEKLAADIEALAAM